MFRGRKYEVGRYEIQALLTSYFLLLTTLHYPPGHNNGSYGKNAAYDPADEALVRIEPVNDQLPAENEDRVAHKCANANAGDIGVIMIVAGLQYFFGK